LGLTDFFAYVNDASGCFGLSALVRRVRFLDRRFNLLPWLVVRVAPFVRPFPPAERAVLLAQFDTPGKRDRVIDVFAQMGRDHAFMRATVGRIQEHMAAVPTLLLDGQFDPMRLIGGVARWKRLFPRSAVEIISRRALPDPGFGQARGSRRPSMDPGPRTVSFRRRAGSPGNAADTRAIDPGCECHPGTRSGACEATRAPPSAAVSRHERCFVRAEGP